MIAQRKKSAPAIFAQIGAPELPPRNEDSGTVTGKTSRSQENLQDNYAVVDVSYTKKNLKGHRRNKSADLHIRGDQGAASEGQSSEAAPKPSSKIAYKKTHRRMKSHETISTIYNQTQSQEKDAGASSSGKSSAESSFGESASVLKEIQGSSGKIYIHL